MTVLLRTLARKSVLDFGKHKDRSVQQLLDLKHYRVLRWYYYNCSMISFLPDILDEIGIPEESRIAKPGKDPEKGAAIDAEKDANMKNFRRKAFYYNDTDAMGKVSHDFAKERKKRKSVFVGAQKQDRNQFRKGVMAWKNQGH